MPQPIERPAARVLLIDEAERVLLFHGFDPAEPDEGYWFTPGGAVEAGETPAEGAARELFEETGLRVEPAMLGEPVFRDEVEFAFGGRSYRGRQAFFLFRVTSWEVDTAGFNEVERASMDRYHWWSAAELESTPERFYPPALPGLLRRLVEV